MPNLNTPLILYYSTFQKPQDDAQAKIFNHLETSLSITLNDFYPLAGRYMRNGSFIDCSDQGALYVEAVATFRLSEFLDVAWEMKFDMLHDFLPCEIGEVGEIDDPMLSIKVTIFECGGVAIGMCFSHKFSDMSTMSTFIDNWANKSQDIVNPLELGKNSPTFGLASRFPKRETVDHSPRLPRSSIKVNTPVRIFSFKGNAISKMRDELIFKGDRNRRPSKVQLIVALLWKAFVRIDKANNIHSKASLVQQGVNLRDKVVPKLPHNVCGNFVSTAVARIEPGKGDGVELEGFFTILHDSIRKFDNSYAKALSDKDYEVLSKPFMEYFQNITNNDVDFYAFTSWCKFSLYKADFGWGKPVWTSTGQFAAQNFVILMDDQEGDGIEAWVHLDQKRMSQLEQDSNIQMYAL
uniref:stemmadenine O-acetyltransferase-like n=1 Tax=Erigeron canadensis TaxID=72917 RepID=UPI001CB9A621|nr:stemmadenine O-acetyltransferase-like [Erigeron canadensis]